MIPVIFWFRNDLRLHDQPALHAALAHGARQLLPVLCLPDAAVPGPWGFARIGPHRRAWLASAIQGLRQALQQCGCPLLVCPGPAANVLPTLARAVGASAVLCEAIAAPDEQAEVSALRAAGLAVHPVWQSSHPPRCCRPPACPTGRRACPQTACKAKTRPWRPLPARPPRPMHAAPSPTSARR